MKKTIAFAAALIGGLALSSKDDLQAMQDSVDSMKSMEWTEGTEAKLSDESAETGLTLFEVTSGKRPIHYAAYAGNSEVIKLLAERGADVDVQDDIGTTALHWATSAGHAEATKVLIDLGAEVNLRDFHECRQIAHTILDGELALAPKLAACGERHRSPAPMPKPDPVRDI